MLLRTLRALNLHWKIAPQSAWRKTSETDRGVESKSACYLKLRNAGGLWRGWYGVLLGKSGVFLSAMGTISLCGIERETEGAVGLH